MSAPNAAGSGSSHALEIGLFALFSVAMALVPLFGGAYLTTVTFSFLIAYVVAQSWDWLHGEAGYVNLGHYIYFGIGAYAFAIAYVRFGLAVPFCFLAGAIVTGIVAAIISFPLFRLKGDYFAFATLALLPLLDLLAANLKGITSGTDGIPLPPASAILWGIDVKYLAYFVAVAASIAVFAASVAISRNRFGFALKAIRNDEEAAEVVGIRIFPAKLQVMVLSAIAASVAGGCYVWSFRYIDPTTVFGLSVALLPVAMALLGGTGLLWGPLIGAILLSAATQMLLTQLDKLQFTIIGLAILLIGRFMPGGLLRAGLVRRIPLIGSLGAEHHERHAEAAVVGPDRGEDLPLQQRAPDRSRPLLEVKGVTMAFGGNVAVNNVSLTVKEGEILGLIGPNGSGKTTLFNCLSKVYEPVAGDIVFDGQSFKGFRRDMVSHAGIGRTYQIPRPFSDLTVQENIAMPLMFRGASGGSLERSAALAEAVQFARFAGLGDRLGARADSLNLQQRKALEFARALACRPKLLLVDEVASGLTAGEVKRFVEHIRTARDTYGITIIWVEHIFSALSQCVDRLVVLEQGAVIADGPLDQVLKDERVLSTYFGSAKVERA
jgi:branched-chain amino acid transport system permease protein